jgi:hypothetical protein
MSDIHSYDLPKPFWMILRDEAPQREKAIGERIRELQDQRGMIDLEIQHYQQMIAPASQPTLVLQPMASWQASLSGFHNPRKHNRLTVADFLTAYKKRLAMKKAPYHQGILKWVEANEAEVVRFATQRFSRTLTTFTN